MPTFPKIFQSTAIRRLLFWGSILFLLLALFWCIHLLRVKILPANVSDSHHGEHATKLLQASELQKSNAVFLLLDRNDTEQLQAFLSAHPEAVQFHHPSSKLTLLEYALTRDGISADVISQMLKCGACKTFPKAANALKFSLLHHQPIAIFQLLLTQTGWENQLLTAKGPELLWQAIRSHRTDLCRLLLSKGVVQVADTAGCTPLILAASSGQDEIVEMLLAHPGPKLQQQDKNGNHLLHLIYTQNPQLVIRLIRAGLSPSTPNQAGETPLLLAVRRNLPPQVLLALLQNGDGSVQADRCGNTPLREAIRHRNLPAVQLFYPERTISGGKNSPLLHLAVVSQSENILRYLLEREENPRGQDATGRTPLHWAAITDQPSLITLLLKHGADPMQTDSFGFTAADLAFAFDSAKAANALHSVSTANSTPQLLSLRKCLRLCSARQPVLSSRQREAFQSRLQNLDTKWSEILDLFNTNEETEESLPSPPSPDPVILATARTDAVTLLPFLLAEQFTTEGLDSRGYTPLLLAAEQNQPQIAMILCEFGCNLDMKTPEGLTAEQLAAAKGHPQLATMLSSSLYRTFREITANTRNQHQDASLSPALPDWQENTRKYWRNHNIFSGRELLFHQIQKQNAAAVRSILQESDFSPDFSFSMGKYSLLDPNLAPAMFSVLLETGANPNVADIQGNTPLLSILQSEHPSRTLLLQLLKRGAAPDVWNHKWQSSLLLAAAKDPLALKVLRFFAGIPTQF